MRGIQAIGYDMDYTLIHYRMSEWEQRAYAFLKSRLAGMGLPVADLSFDPELVTRGLIIDTVLGNVVKANRFGYIQQAFHGTSPIGFEDKKEAYRHTLVDLAESRWKFLNTLFSISEACMYMQLIDLMDRNGIEGLRGYSELYGVVKRSLDEAHVEGSLKAEIVSSPDKFVELDPNVPLTLLDQKHSGKRLLLITNSEWGYASPMMSFAFDQFLPAGVTWRDLFDIIIVAARKPDFFAHSSSAFELADNEGLFREHSGSMTAGGIYAGGNATLVETSLGLAGDEILYVGDHIFADVNVSKSVNRWRTALVIRELEEELQTVADFQRTETELARLMGMKEALETRYSQARLAQQRRRSGYAEGLADAGDLDETLTSLREELVELDDQIRPLAVASSRLLNPRWGLLMRTGNDKSHLARQIERYADMYTSRVSNFLHYTPFAYLRAHRGSLPHDAAPTVSTRPSGRA
jgi:HAD superfamily 5'-nucleotidase-like hydrolase